MTNRTLIVKPGPRRLAAALKLSGFSQAISQPPVTDACGRHWTAPTELHVALALCGGEASGNCSAYHVNADGSTDYGVLEINNHAHPEYFQGPVTPVSWNWLDYLDNCDAAFELYVTAKRTWKPWNAYAGGGWIAERYQGRSWLSWADYGVTSMLSSYQALVKAGKTPAAALAQIASIDDDPLIYG